MEETSISLTERQATYVYALLLFETKNEVRLKPNASPMEREAVILEYELLHRTIGKFKEALEKKGWLKRPFS